MAYTNHYQNEVIDLILNIQRIEFGIGITIEDQPDLLDIPGFYQNGGGNFWIALQNDSVIGTIALLDIGTRMGALRKMFVHKDYRGKEHRVAQRLLQSLWNLAGERKMDTLFLGTTEVLHAAHRFYEKNGFEAINKNNLPPQFPVLRIDTRFYKYEINSNK